MMSGSRLSLSLALCLIASLAFADDCSVVSVDGGDTHSIAVGGDGVVWTWGFNGNGELGNGGLGTWSSVPSPVPGLTGIALVSAGGGYRVPGLSGGYSIAVGTDGRVWTWGANSRGQLGDGTTTPAGVPTEVALGASPALSASAGVAHSLLVMRDGTMRATGDNSDGQLGDGTTTDALVPVIVSGVSSALACAAGDLHSLALLADGTVLSWGSNTAGQLGDAVAGRSTPGPVPGLVNVVAIAAGDDHSLALLADGSLLSWGANDRGQLGRSGYPYPVAVAPFGTVVAIAAGSLHSLAVTADGNVWAWGDDSNGQTAWNVRDFNSPVPTRVDGVANAARVGAGKYHSLAAGDEGSVWAFGQNGDGRLGDGFDSVVPTPRRVTTGGVASVSGRDTFRLALLAGGTVATWGDGYNGQLGFGYRPLLNVLPSELPSLSGVAQVVAGSSHALALLNDGSLYAWGRNGDGELGDGTTFDRTAPGKITGVPPMIMVSAGLRFSLAVLFDGSVVAWGKNLYGQLGNNSTTDSSRPVPASGPTGVTAIAAGYSHSLAVDGAGQVWAWGWGGSGQRGDGTTADARVPTLVPGLDRAIGAATAERTSAVLRDDGTVWTFGANGGLLGIGSLTPNQSTTPVMVPGLDRVIAIASGLYQFYALRDDGTTWAWGSNSSGELGDGTTISRTSPQRVLAPRARALAISGPAVIDTSGQLWSWGNNGDGTVGIGTGHTVARAVPSLLRELRDPPPPDQGNVLYAVRDGVSVRLTFPGAPSNAWRVFRGSSKLLIGQSPHSPDPTIPEHVDVGAVPDASDFYYSVGGLSACGNPGPALHGGIR